MVSSLEETVAGQDRLPLTGRNLELNLKLIWRKEINLHLTKDQKTGITGSVESCGELQEDVKTGQEDGTMTTDGE